MCYINSLPLSFKCHRSVKEKETITEISPNLGTEKIQTFSLCMNIKGLKTYVARFLKRSP